METILKGMVIPYSGLINADGYPVIESVVYTTYALCDGRNGTPDLVGKYLKMASAAGGEGGANTHSHDDHAALAHAGAAVADHAAQSHAGAAVGNHVVTQPDDHTGAINHTHPVTDPGHTHNIGNQLRSATTGSQTTNIALTTDTSSTQGTYLSASRVTGLSVNNPTGGVANLTHANGAVDAHQVTQPNEHPILTHAVTQPDGHAAQSHVAASNEPVYYELCPLMKL